MQSNYFDMSLQYIYFSQLNNINRVICIFYIILL